MKTLRVTLCVVGLFVTGALSGWAAPVNRSGQFMLSTLDLAQRQSYVAGYYDGLNEMVKLIRQRPDFTPFEKADIDSILGNMLLCFNAHGSGIENTEKWAETLWRAHPDKLAADAIADACGPHE